MSYQLYIGNKEPIETETYSDAVVMGRRAIEHRMALSACIVYDDKRLCQIFQRQTRGFRVTSVLVKDEDEE